MRFRIFIASVFSAVSVFGQFVDQASNYSADNFPDVYGGKEEWKRFLHDHMVYPRFELAEKFEGPVKIYFVVTKEGKAVKARVTKGVSVDVDKEAMRLLNLVEWIPAYQGDSLLMVQHSVEINFSASKYKKWVKERGYEAGAFVDMPMDSSFAIYEMADKKPSFADPDKTFPEFVNSTLEYPEMARKQGLGGNVVMTFIVEPDGCTSNIRIKKGVGGGCNEEATHVIGLTKWKPAQKNGKYVRFRMYYTMTFNVNNSFKDNSSGSQRVGGQ